MTASCFSYLNAGCNIYNEGLINFEYVQSTFSQELSKALILSVGVTQKSICT